MIDLLVGIVVLAIGASQVYGGVKKLRQGPPALSGAPPMIEAIWRRVGPVDATVSILMGALFVGAGIYVLFFATY